MNLNSYFDLTQSINGFFERGFERTFSFENNRVKCFQTGKIYSDNEIEIIEYHRFKNDKSDHPKFVIIIAIECNDGEQGYITSSDRDVPSLQLLKFLDKVKIKSRKSKFD